MINNIYSMLQKCDWWYFLVTPICCNLNLLSNIEIEKFLKIVFLKQFKSLFAYHSSELMLKHDNHFPLTDSLSIGWMKYFEKTSSKLIYKITERVDLTEWEDGIK
jgi:hypothetical protein